MPPRWRVCRCPQHHGLAIGEVRSLPGSVAAAIALYLGSYDFSRLAPATQYERRRILEHLREAHGGKTFTGMQRRNVDALLGEKAAAPHAARNFLKALRAVIATALAAGLCETDPTAGIRVKLRKTGGHATWSEDDIARFEAHWPIGSRERLAFALLLFTGQRRGDVIRMGRQHIRDGFMSVHQAKTGAGLVLDTTSTERNNDQCDGLDRLLNFRLRVR